MRVFLDTNVIVSAVATRGLCADVMREVLVQHELVVSDVLLDEVESVLRIKLDLPANVTAEVIALLREGAILTAPSLVMDLPLADSSDKALISAALNAKADLFVTGDRELLDSAGKVQIEIVTPRAFWEKARGFTK